MLCCRIPLTGLDIVGDSASDVSKSFSNENLLFGRGFTGLSSAGTKSFSNSDLALLVDFLGNVLTMLICKQMTKLRIEKLMKFYKRTSVFGLSFVFLLRDRVEDFLLLVSSLGPSAPGGCFFGGPSLNSISSGGLE